MGVKKGEVGEECFMLKADPYGRKQTDGKGGSENFLLEVFPKIKTVETITKLSKTKITAQNSKYKESMDQQT